MNENKEQPGMAGAARQGGDTSKEIGAMMPCGAVVSNVYEAYEAGLRATKTEGGESAAWLATMDAAFQEEIKRVSSLEYPANAMCEKFYAELRKRVVFAAPVPPLPAPAAPIKPMYGDEPRSEWLLDRTASPSVPSVAHSIDTPVARLQAEVSDRPFSKGQVIYDMVILDRARCHDGMELFAAAQAAPATPAPAAPKIDYLAAAGGNKALAGAMWSSGWKPAAPQAVQAPADTAGLAALHKELNRITWEGEDEGWNLAITAVQKRIAELLAAQSTPEVRATAAEDARGWEERLADACIECEIPDSQYESLCIALKRSTSQEPASGTAANGDQQ
jgi:hypothetical protein